MAFLTHQLQGLYTPSRTSLKRVDINLSKHTPCLCGEESFLINRIKTKSLRISSFKGRVQSDEYKDGLRESGKNSAEIPFISKGNEGTLSGYPKVQNILYKSWLTLMPSESQNQDQTLEGPSSNESLETDHIKGGILKTVWSKLVGIDATIKIPAVIIIPLFLIVNMKYGPQVAKELIPLWIGGPLLIALYIKMVQALYSLYVFSFKQSVKVVKNFTTGNDKELIRVRLWQHVVYIRNLDYKNESKRIWKEFKEWFGDKCLDFVESMWSYRGTIGFLKITSII